MPTVLEIGEGWIEAVQYRIFRLWSHRLTTGAGSLLPPGNLRCGNFAFIGCVDEIGYGCRHPAASSEDLV